MAIVGRIAGSQLWRASKDLPFQLLLIKGLRLCCSGSGVGGIIPVVPAAVRWPLTAESLCELARRWFWHGGPTNYLFSVLVGRLCVPFPSAGREKPESFVAFRLACHGTVSLPRLCRPVLCRAHWRNCQVFTRAGLALFFDLTAVSLWLQAMFFLPLFVFGLSRMRLGLIRCQQESTLFLKKGLRTRALTGSGQ